MRQRFLTWLLLLVCATFAVTGALAYLQFERQAQERAEQLLNTRLSDLSELISHTEANMRHVEQINDAGTLSRTRAVAEIIRLNPGIVHDEDALYGLCNEVGAQQLIITDAEGKVTAAVPSELVGFELKAHEQSRPFLKCIHNEGEELVQRPQGNAYSGEIIQYAGVSRRDAKGIVQLGFTSMHEQAARAGNSFGALADSFRLGKNGHIIAFRHGELLNTDELSYPTAHLLSLPIGITTRIELADKEYYTYVVEKAGMRMVGLLPVEEMTEVSLESLKQLFISNVWMFAVMFLLVWVLLQRLVLNGLSRINKSLHRIAEGYMDERINVRDTPEFTRLSTGINTMVDALQSYAEHRRERLRRELAMARSVQDTVLPNKFPAFPDQTAFDLYAAKLEANVVGGDFYDYFMADREHLCFMLGDVSTTGIPGALFMMRALSIIRGLASGGLTPEQMMTEANKALCENNITKTRLSLFFARLNIKSGMLRFVNAGTPQALRGSNGTSYEMLPMRSGSVLGFHNKAVYRECVIRLAPGERILLYSQGVLKATDATNTPFGAARLQSILQEATESPTEQIRKLQIELKTFTGNKEQTDDCTMLALEYKGKWMCRYENSVTTGELNELVQLTNALNTRLESVLAAPVAIAELCSSISTLLSQLPAGLTANLLLLCNEEEAELTLQYNLCDFNPSENIPPQPVNHIQYSTSSDNGSTIILRKQLA
ncbi:MAG: SpoIIE family protein phosphatase [Akkermansia sp.]|nr:SpoIIE family protein phosphatase [Akkermansia sp.]